MSAATVGRRMGNLLRSGVYPDLSSRIPFHCGGGGCYGESGRRKMAVSWDGGKAWKGSSQIVVVVIVVVVLCTHLHPSSVYG